MGVTNNHADPDYEWTEPDYYKLDKDTNELVVQTSVVPKAGDTITVSYTYMPMDKEQFGYMVAATYTLAFYSKKNSQGKDDEIFEIDGEKYANGKLVDYLYEQSFMRLQSDYSFFRKRGIILKLNSASEQIYDPDTRRFAKQMTIMLTANFLVEKKELPITDVQGTYELAFNF